MRYFIQFSAGLGGLIVSTLGRDIKWVKVVFQDDSAVIVESSSRAADVSELSYVKNSFVVLGEARRTAATDALPSAVLSLIPFLRRPEVLRLAPKNRPFRVMVSLEGELVSLPRDVRSRLENAIASRTGSWVEARGSGDEYWIIGRRDLKVLLLGLRLPKKKPVEMPKGALSAELSDMLVRASEPRPDDVFMDPFAGKGSLVLARLSSPARRLVYSDVDYANLQKEFRPELARASAVEFLAEDARILPSIEDGSIDVVVTDPPWGEHQDLDVPYEKFVTGVAEGLGRILRPTTGRFVILVGRRKEEVLHEALAAVGLIPSSTHRILVNGHPASVLVGGRRSDR